MVFDDDWQCAGSSSGMYDILSHDIFDANNTQKILLDVWGYHYGSSSVSVMARQFLIIIDKAGLSWTAAPYIEQNEYINGLSASKCSDVVVDSNTVFVRFGAYAKSSSNSVKYVKKYTIDSDNSLNGEISNITYVKPITSEQYIKGVAAESGTAGDTIEVYIPTAS